MSLPPLLLVDDSEAFLAYERAVLGEHYALTLARDGAEALSHLRTLRPAAVLLDLSMAGIDGAEVLRRMQADEALAAIPVIIVSTERERAPELMAAGAAAFLSKPTAAAELRTTVARVIDDAQAKAQQRGLPILPIEVGGAWLALPLSCVDRVAPQPLAHALLGGPSYLAEVVEVAGEPVPVLDLCIRFGLLPRAAYAARKLVIVAVQEARLALAVDDVKDPEIVPPDALRAATFAAGHPPLDGVLRAFVDASDTRPPLPVIEPGALLSRALLAELGAAVAGQPEPA